MAQPIEVSNIDIDEEGKIQQQHDVDYANCQNLVMERLNSVVACAEAEERTQAARISAVEATCQDLGKHQIRLAGIVSSENARILQHVEDQRDRLEKVISYQVQEAISTAKERIMCDIRVEWETMRLSLEMSPGDSIAFQEVVRQESFRKASPSADSEFDQDSKMVISELRRDINSLHCDFKLSKIEIEKRIAAIESSMAPQPKELPETPSTAGFEALSRFSSLVQELTETKESLEQALPQLDPLNQSCPQLGAARRKMPTLNVGPPTFSQHKDVVVNSPLGSFGASSQEMANSHGMAHAVDDTPKRNTPPQTFGGFGTQLQEATTFGVAQASDDASKRMSSQELMASRGVAQALDDTAKKNMSPSSPRSIGGFRSSSRDLSSQDLMASRGAAQALEDTPKKNLTFGVFRSSSRELTISRRAALDDTPKRNLSPQSLGVFRMSSQEPKAPRSTVQALDDTPKRNLSPQPGIQSGDVQASMSSSPSNDEKIVNWNTARGRATPNHPFSGTKHPPSSPRLFQSSSSRRALPVQSSRNTGSSKRLPSQTLRHPIGQWTHTSGNS